MQNQVVNLGSSGRDKYEFSPAQSLGRERSDIFLATEG